MLQEEPPQHVLLSSRLAGLELKVVSGGKDQQVTIANVNGCLRILHKVYNTISNLDPKSVMPKYPNPTRDNRHLVVIRGTTVASMFDEFATYLMTMDPNSLTLLL